MKTKVKKTLPKTVEEISNGSIHQQRIRCGKGNCKCARGEPHTGHYFFTRVNGKLRKFYIRKRELKRFSLLVRKAASERKHRRRMTNYSNQLLREFRQRLSEISAPLKTK